MTRPPRILTASSPEHLLVERIADQERQIAYDGLAPYEPRSATYAWFDTLRAIEECINLIHVDWDDDEFEELLQLSRAQVASAPQPSPPSSEPVKR